MEGISLGIFGLMLELIAILLKLHSIHISIDKLVDLCEKEKENK